MCLDQKHTSINIFFRKFPNLLQQAGGIIFSLCLMTSGLQAQSPKPAPFVLQDPYKQATELARAEQQKGNLAAAYKALRAYIVPRDPQSLPGEIVWYAAQLAYLNQEQDAANTYYERAALKLSGNDLFAGDYGNFLLNTRHYQKAIAVLLPHQESVMNRFYLAKTYYWQGDYQKAKRVINTFSANERSLDFIREFIQEFNWAKSTRLEADLIYHTDDQPLQYTVENFRLSKKLSNFLEPSAEVSLGQFRSDTSTSGTMRVQLGNRFLINPIRTQLSVRVGSFSVKQSSEVLYQVGIHTQLSRVFSLDAHLGRESYLYTIASAQSPIAYSDKSVALNVDGRWLMGRIQYNRNSFENNNIDYTSLWMLVPLLNKKGFKLRLGYAYQYGNADTSSYVPRKSPVGLEQNIVGVYNPYFTPSDQQVHNALVQIQAFPTSRLSASLSASLPLSAQIDNPYLYTRYDANSNVVIERGFLRTSYRPVEIKASLGYKFSGAVSLTAGYQYASLFFYKGHSLNLSTGILL